MPDPNSEPTAMVFFKAALGRKTVPEDILGYMEATLDRAREALRRSGIEPDESSPADCALLAAYAEWIYKRRNAEDPKPRALVDEIRSRQIARTTGGDAS